VGGRAVVPRSRRLACVAAVALVLLACGQKPQKASLESQLLGTWDLSTVAGQGVDRFGLHDWHVTFVRGTWKYAGQLGGALSGMHVDGQGHWQLRGNTLLFAVGATSGSSIVKISERELTMTPHPILAKPGSGNPVITTYVRHRGFS
jgi:hypothetical protein